MKRGPSGRWSTRLSRLRSLRAAGPGDLRLRNVAVVARFRHSGRICRRPQLRGRLGRGGKSVRLYSQAGNITLAGAREESSRVVTTGKTSPTPVERRETNAPGQVPTPAQRPELAGPAKNPTAAGTPAPVSTGPEEISEGDVIRVDTELVSVNVSVVDRGTNRGVNDLTKDNFRLYEDNVAQQIAHFESASAPFNLVLLIDLSGSTAKVVELIKGAAMHFVEAARPFDRIAVITFAGSQVVVSPLTNDHAALRQRINAIEKPEGSTKLYDSLAFAMDEVFREAKDSRRNAIDGHAVFNGAAGAVDQYQSINRSAAQALQRVRRCRSAR